MVVHLAMIVTLLGLLLCRGLVEAYDGFPDDTYKWRVRKDYYYPSVEVSRTFQPLSPA